MGPSDHAMTAHKRVAHAIQMQHTEGGAYMKYPFPFMTINEYCKVMRISRNTFYRRKNNGDIPQGSVIQKQGQRPIINFAKANPEGYAVLKELMGR